MSNDNIEENPFFILGQAMAEIAGTTALNRAQKKLVKELLHIEHLTASDAPITDEHVARHREIEKELGLND